MGSKLVVNAYNMVLYRKIDCLKDYTNVANIWVRDKAPTFIVSECLSNARGKVILAHLTSCLTT